MPEIIFEGEPLDDAVKKIFTEAAGIPAVGVLITAPEELFSFHQTGNPKTLVEITWEVKSSRVVARQLEEIAMAGKSG